MYLTLEIKEVNKMARKLQETAELDIWRNSYGRSELETMRRQLAKAANQRMVRLENTKSPITGEFYTFGAYDIVSDYLESKGRRRFKETLNVKDMDTFELKREINILQGFITSKSSRIRGMHEIEKQRIESFETKGISFAGNKEFYDFLKSNSFMELTGNKKKKNGDFYSVTLDSDTIIDMYQRYRDQGLTTKQIQSALDDFRRAKGRKSEKRLESYMKKALPSSGNK